MCTILELADYSIRHPGQVVSMNLSLDDVQLHEDYVDFPWVVEMGGVEQLELCARAFAPWAAAARLYCVSEFGGFSFWVGDPVCRVCS